MTSRRRTTRSVFAVVAAAAALVLAACIPPGGKLYGSYHNDTGVVAVLSVAVGCDSTDPGEHALLVVVTHGADRVEFPKEPITCTGSVVGHPIGYSVPDGTFLLYTYGNFKTIQVPGPVPL